MVVEAEVGQLLELEIARVLVLLLLVVAEELLNLMQVGEVLVLVLVRLVVVVEELLNLMQVVEVLLYLLWVECVHKRPGEMRCFLLFHSGDSKSCVQIGLLSYVVCV